jgi:hypothetical protein
MADGRIAWPAAPFGKHLQQESAMRRTPRSAASMTGRLLAAIALACLVIAPAAAQRVEGTRAAATGLYEAEVPVNSQGAGDREAGFARALAEVLAKLSGDRSAASRPGVASELANAGDYVDSYDYRQDEGTSASGAPSYRTILVARFDEEAVQELAAALGIPVWPTPRPKPVLWLAIDDGSGPRLVGVRQDDVARPLTARAIERGYRLGLPAGSAAERAVVGAIWRGDTAAVARASSRYKPPMQLIGKLYRKDGGWRADWIFVDDGRVLSSWSAEERDARAALAAGADGAADALAARYAKAPPSDPAGRFRVVFSGIDSADDYLRLSAWLQGLPVVTDITPLGASGAAVEFELALGTGLSGLARLAARSDVVEAVDDGVRDSAPDDGAQDDGAQAPAPVAPAAGPAAHYRVL